jgi:hypothetical protein
VVGVPKGVNIFCMAKHEKSRYILFGFSSADSKFTALDSTTMGSPTDLSSDDVGINFILVPDDSNLVLLRSDGKIVYHDYPGMTK